MVEQNVKKEVIDYLCKAINQKAILLFSGWFICLATSADVFYVSTNSVTQGPGTTWSNAFHVIQDAIDVAGFNDTVLVTNGVYDTGGVTAAGYGLTNRVCITSAMTVLSVNGPSNTFIVGNGPIGDSAVRGVYLGDGAVLSGFTITNCHTRTSGESEDRRGGGIWCETGGLVTNCILVGNTANYYGGGVAHGTLVDCELFKNNANNGAGAYDSLLNGCVLDGNRASSSGGGVYECIISNSVLKYNYGGYQAGGAYAGTLIDCLLIGNYGRTYGGGSNYGTLTDCTLKDNASEKGGGTYRSELFDCTLSSNSASYYGGGAYEATLTGCLLFGNDASSRGGGSYKSSLSSCTLTGNLAANGGGSYSDTLINCIIYYNEASNGSNYNSSAVTWSCTTPDNGSNGNITNMPLFVDALAGNYRLAIGSLCINAGTNESWMLSAKDLDGNPRIADVTVDIGAFEYDRAISDSDTDGLTDADELDVFGTNPLNSDTDGDTANDYNEIIADTCPTNAADFFQILDIDDNTITFDSSSNRIYTLLWKTNLMQGSWIPAETRWGIGGEDSMSGTNVVPKEFYKLEVELP